MLRKTLTTAAAAVLLSAGIAAAQMSPYPSAADEVGPAAGAAPTTGYPGAPLPAWLGNRKAPDTFPSAANEGPLFGEAPTTSIDRAAVGATGAAGAEGQVGPAMPRGLIPLDD